jgi:hypothetical protein
MSYISRVSSRQRLASIHFAYMWQSEYRENFLNQFILLISTSIHSFYIWPGGCLGLRFGFRVLTASSELIFKKKLKWHHFNKKTKINGLQPDFWSGLAGSYWVFHSLIFSSTWSSFSPGSVGSISTRRAGF